MTYSVRLLKSIFRIATTFSLTAILFAANPSVQAGEITLITWFSGIIFMLIADLSLYGTIGRLVFPNMMSAVLLFGLSPFFTLITTQTMLIVSTRASGMREAQQLGSLVVIPLFLFILGETAILVLLKAYWTAVTSSILLLCTILLLLINLKIFDREYMIASVRG